MAVLYDFLMVEICILSACLGWTHADEPFFDTKRTKMPCRLIMRALLLCVAGMAIMLITLFDPAASKARETFRDLSPVGLKVFWLVLMGALVIGYGAWQLILYDMVANYRTKRRRKER